MGTSDLEPDRIDRAAAGDANELEHLLQAIGPVLRAELSIQPLWRRDLDVEDVLQVSYLEAFLRISTLRDTSPAGFRAWMVRVAQNNLRDAIRALEREKRPDARRRVTRGGQGESTRTLFEALAGDHPTGGRAASLKEEMERLGAAVSRLPASYRRVVEQVDLAQRSVEQVALEMQRSRGAVHLLRSRAHDRLRELLREPE